MKKLLALFLAFTFIFSCFSILGTATASAETKSNVATSVVLKSDFDKTTSTKWRPTASVGNTVSFKTENGDTYASVGGVNATNVGIRSTTFELIPGDTYELTFYFRLNLLNPSKTYKLNDGSSYYYYIPAFVFYETSDDVGASTTTIPTVDQTGNYYVYNQKNNRMKNGFNATWIIGNNPGMQENRYSHFNYQTNTTMVNNLPLTEDEKLPQNMYKDWTKVTAIIDAAADEADEQSQKAAFAVYFSAGVKATNFSFDIKNVQLVNKSVQVEEELPAGVEYNKNFENGSVAGIVADKSEIEVVAAEATDGEVTGEKYLKYIAKENSSGVAFSAVNNSSYKYKVSYDLKVLQKGSGRFKTSATDGEALLGELDHSSATVGEWQHYEFDLGDNTSLSTEIKFVASGSDWQVGIDNIKVEKVSKANLEAADAITVGTYVFSIRSANEENEQGLRFKSKINFNSINLDEGAKIVEYGTLVTAAANKQNLKLEKADGKKVVAGVAYSVEDKIDIRFDFDKNTGELVYTGVITGIKTENYDKDLSVCGYAVVKTASGAKFVIYDDARTISVLSAAQQIVKDATSAEDKAVAQAVIDEYDALNK